MKKITESQLKDKVNSLREYLKVYEIGPVRGQTSPAPAAAPAQPAAADDPNEIPFDPTWGGTKAPADTRNWFNKNLNPFSNAPEPANKNATWNNQLQAAVSNQPKAPAPAPAAPEAPAPAPAAPSTQDLTAAASASGEAVGKSLQRFKELLAKAKGAAAPANAFPNTTNGIGSILNPAAPAAAPAAAQSPYALQANGAKLNANEGTSYFLNKLRLIESRQLNETLTDEEKKELDTLAQSFGDSEDPEIAGLLKQYSDVKNGAMAAPAANQAAAVTPAAPAAPAARPPVAVDPRDGAVGQSLAKMGVSKKDRLDQAFVDSTLGAGKYKAGSAESNMALQAHFKKQGSSSGAPATQAAGSVPASASLAPGEKIMPAVKQSSAVPRATGGAKAVAGLNKEPIQFPANQAAKTNSYDAGRDPNGAYRGDRSDATVMDPKQPGFDFKKASKVANAQNKQVAKESVGYNELQRIMSLVNHR